MIQKVDNVLIILEDILYINLKDFLMYQMIFELSNLLAAQWKKKYSFLSDDVLKTFAYKSAEIIKKKLHGRVKEKFNYKTACDLCDVVFSNKELEMICSNASLT